MCASSMQGVAEIAFKVLLKSYLSSMESVAQVLLKCCSSVAQVVRKLQPK